MPKSSKGKVNARSANRDRRARLEELRKQQQREERRKTWLFAGSGIVLALALIGTVVGITLHNDQAKAEKTKAGYQAAPTAAEKAAGCDGVHNDPVAQGAIHVATPIDYTKEKYGDTAGGTPPIPPSGGPHNGDPLPADKTRFYPLSEKPRPERAVHDLEHGYVVAWYDSKLPAKDVTLLQNQTTLQQRMLAVGWWQGDLPAGKHLVLTSWGRTERCASASADVIQSFASAHVDSTLAPERGSTGGNDSTTPPGQLPPTAAPTMSETPSATPTKSAQKK